MSVRSAGDRLLRGLALLCVVVWTLVFGGLAANSMKWLVEAVRHAAVGVKAAIDGEACAFLFRSAGESFLSFVVHFAVYVALAWWGVERLRHALLSCLPRNDQ